MTDPKEPVLPTAAALAAVQQIEGQVRLALRQAKVDVVTARSESNTKDLLQDLIQLHQDSFSISERIFESAEIRHMENKQSFDKVNENISLLREFFDADLKRVSTELSNLRSDIEKLPTKDEIKAYTSRIEGHVEAIRAQLGVLLKQRLE